MCRQPDSGFRGTGRSTETSLVQRIPTSTIPGRRLPGLAVVWAFKVPCLENGYAQLASLYHAMRAGLSRRARSPVIQPLWAVHLHCWPHQHVGSRWVLDCDTLISCGVSTLLEKMSRRGPSQPTQLALSVKIIQDSAVEKSPARMGGVLTSG